MLFSQVYEILTLNMKNQSEVPPQRHSLENSEPNTFGENNPLRYIFETKFQMRSPSKNSFNFYQ